MGGAGGIYLSAGVNARLGLAPEPAMKADRRFGLDVLLSRSFSVHVDAAAGAAPDTSRPLSITVTLALSKVTLLPTSGLLNFCRRGAPNNLSVSTSNVVLFSISFSLPPIPRSGNRGGTPLLTHALRSPSGVPCLSLSFSLLRYLSGELLLDLPLNLDMEVLSLRLGLLSVCAIVFDRFGACACAISFCMVMFRCVGISSGSSAEENDVVDGLGNGMVGMIGTVGMEMGVGWVVGAPMPTPETWRAS